MTTPHHELDGRVAVVTGASRGIGLAIARRFAAAGAHVAVVARSLDASSTFPGTLAETVRLIEDAGGKALPIRADITLAEDRGRLVEEVQAQLGRIDVLVNNAGRPRTHRPRTSPPTTTTTPWPSTSGRRSNSPSG